MSNRLLDIDLILKYFYKEACRKKLDVNVVYQYLIGFGVSDSSRKKDIGLQGENFFSKWCFNFQDKGNIKVYVQENWDYFCQFINTNRDSFLSCIRMSIPLDYEHIDNGVNEIFSFLERNNIKHFSNVTSNIRGDDVVVRLYNRNDALRLQEFLSRDKYIREGLMKSNPFSFNVDGIGYSYENMSSYDVYVAGVIVSYINDFIIDRGKTYYDVSMNSFLKYVDAIRDDVLCLEEFVEIGDINDVVDVYYMNEVLRASMKSNDIRDYYKVYESASNSIHRTYMTEKIENDDRKALLSEFILVTMKKYPLGYDRKQPSMSGYDYILSYLHGNDEAVPMDIRYRVLKYLSSDVIYDIIIGSGIIGSSIDKQVYNYVRMVMFDDIIKTVSERNPNNYYKLIERALLKDKLNYITRDNGARDLAKSFVSGNVLRFFKDMGVEDLKGYIKRYYLREDISVGEIIDVDIFKYRGGRI